MTRIALVTQGIGRRGGVRSVVEWLHKMMSSDAAFEVEIHDLATSANDAYSRRVLRPGTWLKSPMGPIEAAPGVFSWGANWVEWEPCRYLPRRQLTDYLQESDLIQVVAGSPALGAACLRAGRPVILQVATTAAWERKSQADKSNLLTGVRRLTAAPVARLEASSLRGAAHVFVENGEMLEHVRALGQLQVTVAPPGVDTDRFTPETAWNSRGPILSVCRLADERKGLVRMLRIYAALRAARQGRYTPPLVLAGRGPVPSALYAEIGALDIGAHVEFLPDTDPSSLPALYRTASCYLQTSYEEGLGISSIEAAASGLPVVASRTAGSSVAVSNGRTGFLLDEHPGDEPFVDALNAVLDERGQQLSHESRQFALEHFSEAATYRPFAEKYRELMPERCL